jgi:hypothetical protein
MKEIEQHTSGRVVLSTGPLYGIVERLQPMAGSANRRRTGRRRAYRLTPFRRSVTPAEGYNVRALKP